MAKQLSQPRPIVKTVAYVVKDGDQEIARMTASEIIVRHPGGRIDQRKLHPIEVLDDNTGLHPTMLFGQNAAALAVCPLCCRPPYRFPRRDRPRAGLMCLENAKRCAGPKCGVLCCPKHRVLCSDNKYRCTRCARTWFWRQLLLGCFFAKDTTK